MPCLNVRLYLSTYTVSVKLSFFLPFRVQSFSFIMMAVDQTLELMRVPKPRENPLSSHLYLFKLKQIIADKPSHVDTIPFTAINSLKYPKAFM